MAQQGNRMADDADNAVDSYEKHHQRNIEQLRRAANSANRELIPKGRCYFCAEPFPNSDKRLFCDTDCLTDHAKQQNYKAHKR